MLSTLKTGHRAPRVPAEQIQATYGRYRMQALLSVFLGYLAYYIVRNNFTLSTPYLKEQLELSATQIGLLSSCMLIAYGISKGVMSSLADKASPKVFMACGLVLCAIVNVGLGFSTAFWIFAALVILNGIFRGMGLVPLSSPLLTGFLAGSRGVLALSGIYLTTSVEVLLLLLLALLLLSWVVNTGKVPVILFRPVWLSFAVIVLILGKGSPRKEGLPSLEEMMPEERLFCIPGMR
ncbi:MFS transporter [Escherichia coli]|uniref:MFS transporter n=1 Tax=Escherichia coli TaxID=562 RepID=UPI0023597EDE|nr:MFS transporter [Escherichia coli]MDC9037926.1 MFS transporter [Escherichia coli]